MKEFNGDKYLKQSVANLLDKHSIELAIETGTYKAETTRALSYMAKEVVSIESSRKHFYHALDVLEKRNNTTLLLGQSEKRLPEVLKKNKDKKILFYLDAHGNRTPLLKELDCIADAKLTHPPVIVIHDFQVPDKPHFGYDTYDGQPYTWEWVKPHIEAIYTSHNHWYNNKATGKKRGVLFCSQST